MSKITIEFPDDELRDRFLAWMSNSGEQEFMNIRHDVDFDYSKAFKAWGYNSEVDGEPTIIVKKEA